MNPVLQSLSDQVSATRGVLKSADVFVKGVPALVQSAVDQALANGATADELAPLTDLVTALKTDSDQLTADIAANSPQSP